jgi:hypothetical protein
LADITLPVEQKARKIRPIDAQRIDKKVLKRAFS